MALPALQVLADAGAASSQATSTGFRLTVPGTSGDYILTDGTHFAALPAGATAPQIQAALTDAKVFGTVFGTVTVTAVAGQSQTFDITVTGSLPQVATNANAVFTKLDYVSPDFVIGADFQFPTIQSIVDTLTTAMNNGLADVLGGSGVAIQGEVDVDNKVLSFDIQAHLSAGINKTLDLGSGFTDLGLKLQGNTVVQLSVGLNLDVTLGLDFSHLDLSNLTGNMLAQVFYVQFNQLQATGDVSISIPHLALDPAPGYSSDANGLSIDNGQINLNATVDVGVNAGSPIHFSDLASIGSKLAFAPHAVFSMTLPITGMLSKPGLTLAGTLTVTVHPYDVFSGTVPDFDLDLKGSVTIADFFHASGEIAFTSTTGTLVRNDGTSFTNAHCFVVSGAGISIFAGNAPNADPTAPGAVGLVMEDVGFTLLLFTDNANAVSYTALKTTGGSASFIGVSGLTMDITDFTVEVNTTSDTKNPGKVLDFNPAGTVQGVPITPIAGPVIDFAMTSPLLEVSGTLDIQAFGYVAATATFAMERQLVDIDTGGHGANLTGATLLTFELSNVNLFAGVNGGFVTDPGTGNVLLDANGVATLDIKKATGFEATGGTLGLAVVTPDQRAGADNRSYLAMTSNLGSATLLGLPPDVTISASNTAVQINKASGMESSGTAAVPLDWTTALGAGKSLTFFANTANATTLSFMGDFTRVAGTLNLKAFNELEANATFDMSSQTVDVKLGATAADDLQGAKLLLLNLTLFDPDKVSDTLNGPKRGLVVGVPGGIGFGVDSGSLTYALVKPNSDRTKSPTGFDGTYSALLANVNGLTVSGLPDGVQIAAPQFNFIQNGSSGTAPPTPTALNWSTMVGTLSADGSFTAKPVTGLTTLTDPEFSVGGSLTMNIKNTVLASGTFSYTQRLNQTVSDGTALTATPLTGVTVQSIAVSNLNLFVGVNGAFSSTSDSNGNPTIDPTKGTGFNVTGASLDLVNVSETTGQLRSWSALEAHVGQMTVQGLPDPSFTLAVQSLDLLYNGPDKTTGSKLNWAGITGTSFDLSAMMSMPISKVFAAITNTTDISVSGTLQLDLSGTVIASGSFGVTEKSGLTVNDGSVSLANASELVVKLTKVSLFVGTGATLGAAGVDTTNATGFSVSNANIDIAVINEDPAAANSRKWVAVAASIGSMAPVGLPAGFTVQINDINVLDNSAAGDGSRLNWKALAGQPGDGFALDNTQLTNVTRDIALSVSGDMMIAIEGYIYVSGAVSLMRSEVDAQTSDSTTSKRMSALTLGAKKLRAFVGPGNADANSDGVVDDPSVLQSNGDVGVAVTVDEMALVVMRPVAASTQSYFALKASGSATLIGVDDVTLTGNVDIDINRGKDTSSPTPATVAAINFQASFPAVPANTTVTPNTPVIPAGLKVSTGPGATDFEYIDFTKDTLNVSGFVSLGISQFVFATGNFAIAKTDAPQTVTLAGGSTATVSMLKIGASDADLFVGTGGPYFRDSNGDGVINMLDTPAAAGATGVAVSDVAFGLAVMKSQAADANSYYALQASGSASLVGVPDVTLSSQKLMIQANAGSSGAVDFGTTFGASGLSIPTGTTPIVLGGSADTAGVYNGPYLSASGTVALQIGRNAYVSGSVAFSKGGIVTATLSDGSTKSLSKLELGGSGLSAFFGANGPATNPGAMGLSIQNVTFGLALMTPTDSRDNSRYYGVTASADSVSLMGISDFTLAVTNPKILVDGGTDATVADRVVDFTKISTDGGTTFEPLSIPTGPSTTVTLNSPDFSSKTTKVSGTVDFGIAGIVTLQGSVAVKISPTQVDLVDTNTGPIATPVPATSFEVGLSNGTASVTAAGKTASFTGVTLGLDYFEPTSPDTRSWLALKTSGGTIAAGSSGFTIGVSNVTVAFNKGLGASNTTFVDFTKTFESAPGLDDGAVLIDTDGGPTVRLDFATNSVTASATADLTIGDYFFAHGDFSFTSLGNKTVTLVGGKTATVAVETLGVTGADVFVGNNGPYQKADGTLNQNAEVFSLNGVNFVVVNMTETAGNKREWDAVYATASSAALVGINDFTLSAQAIQVQINTAAADGSVVDFATTYSTTGHQLTIATPSSGSLNIGCNSKMLQVSASVTLVIDHNVYVSGNLAFSKGATVTATLSDETTTKQVSILTVGASNVNIFVGVNGPYQNPDGTVIPNSGAMGLSVQNASFGLALLKPMDPSDHSSYYGLKATASSVGVVGLDPAFLDLKLGGLSVEVNGGTDATVANRVVDFTKGNLDGSAVTTDHAMSIPTGGTPVTLDGFTAKKLQASAADAVLSIGGFVQVRGGFAFSMSAPILATLSDGTSKDLEVATFGFSDLSAFVGEGSYWDVTGSGGSFSVATNPDAAGLLLSGGDLAVALFKPTVKTDNSSYYAVSASLDTISLPGLDLGGSSDEFNLAASGYRIEVNGGTNKVAVNFTSLPGAKLTVATSTTTSKDFAYRSGLVRMAIDNATLSIGNYVYISGGLSFTELADLTVKLSDQAHTQETVNAFAFGAGSVDLFVGTGFTGFDPTTDAPNSNAVGLALEDVNFGLMVMRPTTDTSTKYIALKATAQQVGLVGIDDLTLSASDISVEYNAVKSSAATSATPVVDFKTSFPAVPANTTVTPNTPAIPAGYALDLGNGSLTFDYSGPLLSASVGNADLQIGSYVFISGGLAFEKGTTLPTGTTLSDGSQTTSPLSAINIGAAHVSMFFGANGPYQNADGTTNPNAVGLSITDANLALAVLTPDDGGNRYIGLKASVAQASFVGSDAFQSTIDNGAVALNIVTGSGVTDETPVVKFSALNSGAGYTVATSTTTSTVLDFSSRRIHASADNVLLNVGGFVYLKASVALDIGSQRSVIVNTGIPTAFGSLAEGARFTINQALTDLSTALTNAKGNVQGAFQSAIQTVVDTVKKAESSVIQTIIGDITKELQTALADVKQGVMSQLTAATSSLTATMSSTLLDPIVNNIVQGLPSGPIQSLLTKVLDPIKSLLTKEMDKVIQQAVNNAVNRIAGSISNAINSGAALIGQALTAEIQSLLDPEITRIQAELTALSGKALAELDPIFAQLQGLAGIQFGLDFATVKGIQTNVTSIGIGNATAFIGMPSPKSADETEQQHLATMLSPPTGTALGDWLDQQGAVGLFVQNFTMGLGLFKPLVNLLPSFTAAKINADEAGFVDGGANILTLDAQGIEADLNLGGPIVEGAGALLGNATIDFPASFPANTTAMPNTPAGYPVLTGTTAASPTVYLDFQKELIHASVSSATIQISQFVYITGSIAFDKGATQTVAVTGGLLTGLTGGAVTDLLNGLGITLPTGVSIPATGAKTAELSFTTIGASDVHAFVGMGGPYWIKNPDTTAKDKFIAFPKSHAVGLAIENFDFGLAMMKPTNPIDFEKYFSLEATANTISLVGIQDVSVNAHDLKVELNESSPSLYGEPLFPVVDWAHTPQFASEELALFDTSHNGSITMGELAAQAGASHFAALHGIASTDKTPVDHTTLLSILDTDNDGTISLSEAATLLSDGTADGDAAATAKAKAADANGNGIVDAAGFGVDTGTGTPPVYLNMDSPLIRAQGFLFLDVKGVVALAGSFAFELGPTQTVNIVGGSKSTDTVTTMTIGASHVFGFVGWTGPLGSPYFLDGNGNKQIDVDASGNPLPGEVNPNAHGLALNDLNVGVFAGLSTNLLNPSAYFAMNLSVGSLKTVGLDFLDVNATLGVKVNIGASLTSLGVIDFANSQFKDATGADAPKGSYAVNTGDPANPVRLDFSSFLVDVEFAGDLTVKVAGTPVVEAVGTLFVNIDGSGFKLFATAALRVGPDIGTTTPPLLDIKALGVIVVNADGFAADLDVNLDLNIPVVTLTVGARVIINTTGKDQEVTIPSRIVDFLRASTNPLAADVLARLQTKADGIEFYDISQYQPDITDVATVTNLLKGSGTITYLDGQGGRATSRNYVVAVVGGTIDLAGFASGDITAGVGVSSSQFQLYASVHFSLGIPGIDINFKAVGVIDVSSAGLYLSTDVSLDADLTTVLHVNASGTLLIDTTGSTPIFELSLTGDLTIAQVLTISGSFSIDVGIGGPNTWRVALALGATLGPITVSAGGWIQSDGQFSITVGGDLHFGIPGFGIDGFVSGTVSLVKSGTPYVYDPGDGTASDPGDTYTLTVQVSGGVSLTIFGISFGVSATLGGTAAFNSVHTVLTLYAEGCVSFFGCAGGTIATIDIPASIFPSRPPQLATVSNGVLLLNVGDRASRRGVKTGVKDEAYTLTDQGNGVVKVDATLGNDTYTETYSGVSSISGDFGTGTDSLTLAQGTSGFNLPVNVKGEAGDNLTVNATGNGSSGAGAPTITRSTVSHLNNGTGGITYSGVTALNIALASANNPIYIQGTAAGTATKVTTATGGADTIDIGSTAGLTPVSAGTLDNVQGPLSIVGSGTDTLNVDDSGGSGGRTYTLTGTMLTGLGAGAGGSVAYSGVSALNTSLGTGGTTLGISDTNASTTTTVNSGSGNTVNLTTDSGPTTINGDRGNDVINVMNDAAATTINGGNDIVNVQAIGSATQVNGMGDTVNVGSNAQGTFATPNANTGGNLSGIVAVLTVSGGGTSTVNVSDAGDVSNSSFTLTGTTLSSSVSGFGAGGSISYGTLANLNINLGSGNNSFSIRSTTAGATRVMGGSGNDSFNVGSTAPSLSGDVVDGIQGALTIKGNGGTDTMNVSDVASPGSKTGFLTSAALTGMGMGPQGITYNGLSAVNVTLGGGPANQFNIRSTLAGVNYLVSGSTGTDSFYVGSMAGNAAPDHASILAGIQGPLTIHGAAAGRDTVNADDSGDQLAVTGFLTSTALTGMGMGTSGITYSGLGTLNIYQGSGSDTFNVLGTLPVTNLDTGPGDDMVNVSSDAPKNDEQGNLDGIQGALNVQAGLGVNTLNVSDAGATAADTNVVITNSSITGLAPAAITYAATGTFGGGITIWGGSGGNAMHVTSTRSDAAAGVRTLTTINTGKGNDTLIATLSAATDGPTVINGQEGNDLLDSSGSSLPVTVFGGAGDDTVKGGSGGDILFGDDGLVTFPNSTTVLGPVVYGAVRADAAFYSSFSAPNLITDAGSTIVGNDVINGDAGDTILGGLGSDSIAAGDGNNVILGDNGVVAGADGLADANDVYSTDTTVGGNDTISTGSGSDTILGGVGNDSIAAGDGNNVILGDNGYVKRDARNVVQQVKTIDPATGGSDTITAGVGNDTVLGGTGGDSITIAGGDNIVLGDDGVVAEADGQADANAVYSTDTAVGGDDTITAGSGSDTILGGVGSDSIAAGDGNNVVVGDNGYVTRDAGDAVEQVKTIDPATGGSDTITAGVGNNTILGGAGGDSITIAGGNNVVLGDNGVVAEADGLADANDVYSTDTTVGGDDTITAGSGSDTILGGVGSDSIAASDGNNVVVGDNGYVTRDAGDVVQQVTTIDPATGGSDTITAGVGNNTILGGAGNDSITIGGGNNVVLGDDGVVAEADGQADANAVYSTDTAVGGNDTITAGSGSDTILGGVGSDSIAASDGNNVVVGDNGYVTRDAGDAVQQVKTIDPATGGSDTITSGSGNDTVLGGAGADSIAAGDGNNAVLGDDGVVAEADGLADANYIYSTDTTVGGNDTISTGSGSDTILGGVGSDSIAAGGGDNVILGDNGYVKRDASNVVQQVTTIDPATGGNDTITAGVGNNTILGGAGGDSITIAGGNNVVLGDDGVVAEADGLADANAIYSTDTAVGGDDTITAGSGSDTILGGFGSDSIAASDGNNVVVGDNGYVTRDAGDVVQQVTTIDPATGGSDTITAGSGNNTILGGAGNDNIVAGDGNNAILGDNGHVSIPGGVLSRIETTEYAYGGADVIGAGNGNNIILGGNGNDTVTAGNGNNVIFGDDGHVDYNPDGSINLIESTSTTAYGGADSITAGNGQDIIIGGRFGDTITAGDGNDIVIGGSGRVVSDPNSSVRPLAGLNMSIARIETMEPTDGGDNRILTGFGNDIVLGGTGNNWIKTLGGNNILFGANGRITYTNGVVTRAESIYDDEGGNDTVYGGKGDDLLVGGPGNDALDGGPGRDLIIAGNAVLDRSTTLGNFTNPRFRVLTGTQIYGNDPTNPAAYGQALIDPTQQYADPRGHGWWGDFLITLLERAAGTDPKYYGNNYIAGGPGDKTIFGALGDDVIQGHGSIDLKPKLYFYGTDQQIIINRLLTLADIQYDPSNPADVARATKLVSQIDAGRVGAWRFVPTASFVNEIRSANNLPASWGANLSAMVTGYLFVRPSVEDFDHLDANGNPVSVKGNDGYSYIEGGGGNNTIFGDGGQNDIIGGSSDQFSLTSPTLRPSGSNLIFGGAGTDISRNSLGDTSPQGHAHDSDMIISNNGDIFRLVGVTVNGQVQLAPTVGTGSVGGVKTFNGFLSFNYDNYTDGLPLAQQQKIIPRAAKPLDYTPGGPAYAPTAAQAALDIGGSSEIHAEDGDNFIFGEKGNNVIYGGGQDNQIVGGYGTNWISGGAGNATIIGSDGRIFVSRNGLAEPLNVVTAIPANQLNQVISTPGNVQQATINVAGQLKSTVTLIPFSQDATWNATTPEWNGGATAPHQSDDIIFGGIGNDSIHGGYGDDAISGGEAPPVSYLQTEDASHNLTGIAESDWYQPYNPGDALRFNPVDPNSKHPKIAGRTGEFALYDEFDPRRKILLNPDGTANKTGTGLPWFLDLNANDGPLDPRYPASANIHTDGNDALFGDLGNNWIVGGTGQNDLFGGFGNDLLDARSSQDIDGGLNDVPDYAVNNTNRAYGGAGKDVLIADNAADRLIDWVGEYNSYIVPFSAFGMPTVSRTLQPQLSQFLYALSASDGSDLSLAKVYGSDPARNGEPFGELGLVLQKDAAWHDQTGAPTDPQPGNTPGTQRDVLRNSTFNTNQAVGYFPAGGTWTALGGVYTGSAPGGDAVSLYYLDQWLPSYYEVLTNVKLTGSQTNAYILFDYQSATNFKYAGIDQAAGLLRIGQRTAAGWIDGATLKVKLTGGNFTPQLTANGPTATLTVGTSTLSYTFGANVNTGLLALGTHNGSGSFTSLTVQILPRVFTYQITDNFTTTPDPNFTPQNGTWAVSGGRLNATPPGGDAGLSTRPLNVAASSYVAYQATVRANAAGTTAGLTFAYTDANNFLYAGVVSGSNQVVLGHRSGGAWFIDAVSTQTITAGTDYTLLVALDNSPEGGGSPVVNVVLNGVTVLSFNYNFQTAGTPAQGNLKLGLIARGGTASFANVSIRGDDPAYAGGGSPQLAAAAPAASGAPAAPLTFDQLEPIVEAAVRRWSLADPATTGLDEVPFVIADLPGLMIGQTVANTIVIDPTAGGYGWFIDGTPLDDTEFGKQFGRELQATASSPVAGRMDLLTVVMHELGHVLGLGDLNADAHGDGLMDTALTPGTRRLPAAPAPETAAPLSPSQDGAALKPVDGAAREAGSDPGHRGDPMATATTFAGVFSAADPAPLSAMVVSSPSAALSDRLTFSVDLQKLAAGQKPGGQAGLTGQGIVEALLGLLSPDREAGGVVLGPVGGNQATPSPAAGTNGFRIAVGNEVLDAVFAGPKPVGVKSHESPAPPDDLFGSLDALRLTSDEPLPAEWLRTDG